MLLGRQRRLRRRFHGGVAAVGVELTHNAVHVILYGELGEMQIGGNLFVGQAARSKSEQLLLARSEAEFGANALVEHDGALLRLGRDELEKMLAQPRRAHGLAFRNAANCGQSLLGGSVAKQIAADSGTHRLQENFAILFHAKQDDLHVGSERKGIGEELRRKGGCRG